MAGYGIAPIFLIRMAGVSFDSVKKLATPESAIVARELVTQEKELVRARLAGEEFLKKNYQSLTAARFRLMRATLRAGGRPLDIGEPPLEEFSMYTNAAKTVALLKSKLQKCLEEELTAARASLLHWSRTKLPRYLVFATDSARKLCSESISKHSPDAATPPKRNSPARKRERHLLLYLQRICTKNDTFSEFGPVGWGVVESSGCALKLVPRPGIAARESYLERWTASAVAAAVNADQEARMELVPRLHPDGRIDGRTFVFSTSGETTNLDSDILGLLARCDNKTPAYLLDAPFELILQLAERNILRWEMEVPALEPHALEFLLSDIARWRDGSARSRWMSLVQPIAALAERFAATEDVLSRVEIMNESRQRLNELGGMTRSSQRFLYAATNTIGEDCVRDLTFTLGKTMVDQLIRDVEPWIDLWRDCYAFVASRVAAGLRNFFKTAPLTNGAVPLPAFLRHCEMHKISLTGPGLVALAHIGFAEIKEAFTRLISQRPEASEWILTAEECHFVRRDFEFPKFDEYTFPSADVQISARSIEQVNCGDYEWILAELHPPIAMLHHGFYWSCPDKAALASALESTACRRPNFFYGFFSADFTSHTTVRQFDALPSLTNFVAGTRSNPNWRTISPAQTEVFIDEKTGDVGLRQRGSHEYLGSFSRYWIIPLGFHPFYFGRAPHMPRLRCGSVVVQRESWTVTVEELREGKFNGISIDLVIAVERLRADRGLPRFIYVRPTERALRRSGAEGRDKDTKPVFIDLESYLFIEIFYRWLVKAGEIEVTEMLPDPDHLLWQEADGRRTFELRTLIVPRE
jgi:hypothetical protein